MSQAATVDLTALYEQDETAWLEAMAGIAAQRRAEDLDWEHLSEYLLDMARSEKREVRSRLVVPMIHLLKWEYQPEPRGNSWRGSIEEQRDELQSLLESGVLRNHAEEILATAFKSAVKRAAAETGLPTKTFPAEFPFTLDEALTKDISDQ